MDAFVRLLADAIQPPWSYVAGVVVLAILVLPRLTEVYREFRDARTGRRGLELEKLRLEIVKLRRELKLAEPSLEPREAERKFQKIPAAIQPAAPVPAAAPAPKEAPAPEEAPGFAGAPAPVPPRGRFVEWLKRHPGFSRPFLWVFEALMAYFMVTFAVVVVAMPVTLWSDPQFGRPLLVFIVLFYGALGWLSYKAFLTSRRIRKEMSTH
jgi:hypothetical protein